MADYYIPNSEGVYNSTLAHYFRLHIIEETDIANNKSYIRIYLQSKGAFAIVRNAIDSLTISEEISWEILDSVSGETKTGKVDCRWSRLNYTTTNWDDVYISRYDDKPSPSSSSAWSNGYFNSGSAMTKEHAVDGSLVLVVCKFSIKFRPEGMSSRFWIDFDQSVTLTRFDRSLPMIGSTARIDVVPHFFSSGTVTVYNYMKAVFAGPCGHATQATTLNVKITGNNQTVLTNFSRILPVGTDFRDITVILEHYTPEQMLAMYPITAEVKLSRNDAPAIAVTSDLRGRVQLHNWVTTLIPAKSVYSILKQENEIKMEKINYDMVTFAQGIPYDASIEYESSDSSIISIASDGTMSVRNYTAAGESVTITVTATDSLFTLEQRPTTVITISVLPLQFPDLDDNPTVMDVDLMNNLKIAVEYLAYKLTNIRPYMLPIIFNGYSEDPREIHCLFANIHYNAWKMQQIIFPDDPTIIDLSTIIIPTKNDNRDVSWADIVALWIQVFKKVNQTIT